MGFRNTMTQNRRSSTIRRGRPGGSVMTWTQKGPQGGPASGHHMMMLNQGKAMPMQLHKAQKKQGAHKQKKMQHHKKASKSQKKQKRSGHHRRLSL